MLDNIGMVFVFTAFLILVPKMPKSENLPNDSLKIRPNPWSALFLGLAVLVKYPFIMFMPGLIIFYYSQIHLNFRSKVDQMLIKK